jgi:hypothetical protein
VSRGINLLKLKFLAIFICVIAGALLSYFSGLSFGYSALICIVAMLINGFVATIEDELPDGFNNPDGEVIAKQTKLVVAVRVVIWFSFTLIVLSIIYLWFKK